MKTKIKRKTHRPARIGIFGVGLAAYWPQFPGLRETLAGYQAEIERHISSFGADVFSGGLVDDTFAARKTGDFFEARNVDFIICYAATYATSAQVLPVVQRARRSVLVLNLQPTPSLDYNNVDTRLFLANCGSCPVPEISCAFARAGIPFNVVTGVLTDDEKAWTEIREWCEAAAAARNLNYGRIGFLGHVYPGMLDMYSDFTTVQGMLGAHIEILEMCDLDKRVPRDSAPAVALKRREINDLFAIAADSPGDEITRAPAEEDLLWSARVACGLEKLVADFKLDGLTYYYRGLDGNNYEKLGAGLIVGNSMLTAAGIPPAGEGDLKTCLAMLILECMNAGGSFTEFIAMDFKENFLLMGHDGPGHIAISNNKPVLRALDIYHGKRGFGCSVEFSVATGPVTILGITQDRNGRLKMIVAEGESLPGPVAQFGNTNSRLKFPLGPADFIAEWCKEGPTHHVALGVGHVAGKIKKLARILNVEVKEISGLPGNIEQRGQSSRAN
ncbi:MAG: L-fucose/L-arabinose isomerase family protein [Victivallaceae bacterium]|nr:L-fucose/L-arabinose isomerase family protein [Victivallaceae bacterium]